ncbi:MAG: kinase [Candidatus Omnitrophica bacterium CG11_big_fil_rev_8_21_14_0_20_42_13]|uniref:Kinase n=1 Tax=Candidatus Ghiorseimicrobium undicola TaxID=1974746 RepID=A0A2H0LZ02_9BACT|nr:MAG: kinase [Candidatus Omnitrophica bacterium CG11_big_fil_rev_8_21_14_0_20_42_13]
MVISRTPFRISFFGGGTDYPVWYKENGGMVLATTINKYCYLTCRYLPPFFEHKSRIIWSKMEYVNDTSQIQHPAVRECIRFLKIDKGLEIHHDGDLPARTGMGSSSAFTVGLLHALYALKGCMPTKRQLALEAIHLEQDILKENVGSQDQALAAFGGFNLIEFGGINHLQVRPVTIKPERLARFREHLILFFTGFSRTASDIAAEQIKATPARKKELAAMKGMVASAVDILNSDTDLSKFGKLMHENWQIKRKLSDKITTPYIDEIYNSAINSGALGGKVLGAGGGGFMMFFAEPKLHTKIREKLKKFLYVPFSFETLGSQIIFYSPADSLSSV